MLQTKKPPNAYTPLPHAQSPQIHHAYTPTPASTITSRITAQSTPPSQSLAVIVIRVHVIRIHLIRIVIRMRITYVSQSQSLAVYACVEMAGVIVCIYACVGEHTCVYTRLCYACLGHTRLCHACLGQQLPRQHHPPSAQPPVLPTRKIDLPTTL